MENLSIKKGTVSQSGIENIDEISRFGRFLREKRLALKKTALQIAAALDFTSDRQLLSWELGKGFPEESKLQNIAKVYGVDFEQLIIEFRASKQARELEKSNRRDLRHVSKRSQEPDFPATDGRRIGSGLRRSAK